MSGLAQVSQRFQLPAWSAAQAGLQMLVAVLSARWLGPADRGSLVLATTLATLLLLLSGLGVGTGARVVLAEPSTWWTWPRYVVLAGAMAVPHGFVALVVGLPVLGVLTDPDPATQALFVLYSALALSASLLREGLHGRGLHRQGIGLDVLAAAIQLVLTAAIHHAGRLTVATALAAASACLVLTVLGQLAVGQRGSGQGPRLGCSWRVLLTQGRMFVAFSLPGLVTSLGQSFVIHGDRLVLGAVGSSAAVGVYSAASSLAALAWFIPAAFTGVLTRRVAATGSLQAWERSWKPFVASSAVLACVTGSLGTMIFPLLLGADYREGASLVAVLSIAAIPYAVYQYDSAACQGLRDLKTGTLGALSGSLLVLVVLVPIIIEFGPPGAAVGMIAVYTAMAAVARFRLRRLQNHATEAARGAVAVHVA
ncbi:lipopolysaccharide biosynthesis protein [Blastococcus saxobsidens]|uniref:O-antigen/teichoic acid export membrane protein n=1 Tax=Blastococcus saxobsidens TaxID=138336 RepID=A0A4Q7YD27_9ACTN|nr:oligosaccharide flippase family protein [Blastococcus saxobsidens]RZU34125.1 O-antigen/teichoic acid export membrane protein [Blastococcus saxobsidens]